MAQLFLTNSLTSKKEEFQPIDHNHVKMYACGPTVYERPHLGNARAAVVYDLLYRLLCYEYHTVTYVRNITDVDDKIIHASLTNNISINKLTTKIIQCYHDDMKAIHCLTPTVEPRATDHIAQMIDMTLDLIRSGHAYHAEGHVLFDIQSSPSYGELANRSIEDMIAGARVEVAPFKKNAGDFVLWKPAKPGEEECSFASPWGQGRPGWHIECSAMSFKYLGQDFDIHGGGADLIFPHHENELVQSKCARPNSKFANYWVHNGFLTVNGEKMSKSLGNFKTVRELIEKGVQGSIIRYFYFTAQYKKPLDLTDKAIEDATKAMRKLSECYTQLIDKNKTVCEILLSYLMNDMNTPAALAHLHLLASESLQGNTISNAKLLWGMDFLGLEPLISSHTPIDVSIIALAAKRLTAKKAKDWAEADLLRKEIELNGYNIIDTVDGYVLEPRSQ